MGESKKRLRMASTDITRAVNPLRNDVANNGAFYANGRYTGIFRDGKDNQQLQSVIKTNGGTFLATSAQPSAGGVMTSYYEQFKRTLLFNGSSGGTYDWNDWGLPFLNDCGTFPDAIIKDVYIFGDNATGFYLAVLFSISPEQPYTPLPPTP